MRFLLFIIFPNNKWIPHTSVQNKYSNFIIKHHFVMLVKILCILFFLESLNQVFAFKEPSECDSLICCCIIQERQGRNIVIYGNEDLRLFPREAGIFLNLDLYFSMNKDSNK
jgi:hypothetical protein